MSEDNKTTGTPGDPIEASILTVTIRKDRIRWMRERFIPVMSLIMAIISLTVAYFTVTRSLESGRRLDAIIDNLSVVGQGLQVISANLTTQYINEFPHSLRRLAEVLDEAQPGEQITIICDFPGYGIYSDHTAYLEYSRVIKSKALKANITMVVLNKNKQRHVRTAQFKERKFEEIKDTPKFEEFLDWARRDPATIQTKEAFLRALDEEQDEVWKTDFKSVTRRMSNESMPMFLWIVGDRVAVFSIPNLLANGGAIEAAFITRDQRLIDQLKVIAQSY